VLRKYEPLARGEEPYSWKSEGRIAPWAVYVLEAAQPCIYM
jgi:hypothetical protein